MPVCARSSPGAPVDAILSHAHQARGNPPCSLVTTQRGTTPRLRSDAIRAPCVPTRVSAVCRCNGLDPFEPERDNATRPFGLGPARRLFARSGAVVSRRRPSSVTGLRGKLSRRRAQWGHQCGSRYFEAVNPDTFQKSFGEIIGTLDPWPPPHWRPPYAPRGSTSGQPLTK